MVGRKRPWFAISEPLTVVLESLLLVMVGLYVSLGTLWQNGLNCRFFVMQIMGLINLVKFSSL